MTNPHCDNGSGHAQAALVVANDNKSTFQTALLGVMHGIRALTSLAEDSQDAEDLRDLKQTDAILQRVLKRS